MNNKLFVAMFLSLCLALCVINAFAVESGTCGTNTTWVLDDDGTLTISGTGTVGDFFSSYRDDITNVIINSGVTSIGEDAFRNCSNLNSVTIPSSVTSIGSAAFRYCENLNSITILGNSIDIAKGAFYGCLLENFYVNSVEQWLNLEHYHSFLYTQMNTGGHLYVNGELLTELVIPHSVTSINDYSFYRFDHIASVSIPDSVTSIGVAAFEYCTGIKSVAIPGSVTSIGAAAFESCALDSVIIQNGVTSIDNYAFYDTHIKSITMPSSVTSIGEEAFGFGYLDNIYVDSLEYWLNYAAAHMSGNLFVDGKKVNDVVIPDGITTIPGYAFSRCDITSITIPDSVTLVGWEAFPKNTSKCVFYNGTEATKEEKLTISTWNDGLTRYDPHWFYSGYWGSCGENAKWGVAEDHLYIVGSDEVTSAPWSSDFAADIVQVTIDSRITDISALIFEASENLNKVVYSSTKAMWEQCMPDYKDLPDGTVIQCTDGTITVNHVIPAAVSFSDSEFTFDGRPHTAEVDVVLPDGFTLQSITPSVSATHVSEGTVTVDHAEIVVLNQRGKDVSRNLDLTITPGSVTILPAALTVTTESATKEYDGTPLTAGGQLSGRVAGDDLVLTTTGSQTERGSTTNTYTLTYGVISRNGDYTITENLGTLMVTGRMTTISGRVVDSVTGGILSGVTVSTRDTSTVTGDDGGYSLAVEDDGSPIQLHFTLEDYIDDVIEVNLPDDGSEIRIDNGLTEILPEGTYRFILTWGEKPSDLDSYMLEPGRAAPIYYGNRGGNSGSLDWDDTDSYGPETITITNSNGCFTYYIHDFTNRDKTSSTALGASGARVRVYNGSNQIASYSVPSGTGNYWTVCRMVNGELITVNRLSNQEPTNDETLTLSSTKSSIPSNSYIYHGISLADQYGQEITIRCHETNQVLTEGVDYTVSYSDPVNAGTCTVTVTGIGAYSGVDGHSASDPLWPSSLTGSFTIARRSLTSFATAALADAVEKELNCVDYTGAAVSPEICVESIMDEAHVVYPGKHDWPYAPVAILREGNDYTVSFSNNVQAGQATATITGRGNFIGTITLDFDIVKEMELPASLEVIESEAFAGTNLGKIVIPGSCTSISPSAFNGCSNLKAIVNYSSVSISAPDSVKVVNLGQ